jgi:hypothetical protein
MTVFGLSSASKTQIRCGDLLARGKLAGPYQASLPARLDCATVDRSKQQFDDWIVLQLRQMSQ